jgi:hypothetical protein
VESSWWCCDWCCGCGRVTWVVSINSKSHRYHFDFLVFAYMGVINMSILNAREWVIHWRSIGRHNNRMVPRNR